MALTTAKTVAVSVAAISAISFNGCRNDSLRARVDAAKLLSVQPVQETSRKLDCNSDGYGCGSLWITMDSVWSEVKKRQLQVATVHGIWPDDKKFQAFLGGGRRPPSGLMHRDGEKPKAEDFDRQFKNLVVH